MYQTANGTSDGVKKSRASFTRTTTATMHATARTIRRRREPPLGRMGMSPQLPTDPYAPTG